MSRQRFGTAIQNSLPTDGSIWHERERRLVLFGAGSPIIVDYIETCLRLGWSVAAVVRNDAGPVHFEDGPRILDSTADLQALAAFGCICPLFTPANRASAVADALKAGLRFGPPLVDPTAVVASNTRLGDGSFVNAGCVLGAAGVVGRHVVINRASSIGHHAVIGDFVSIGPGVTLCGQVEIGPGAMIGAGAVVLPQVRIGAFACVAAGAVVSRDVPEGAKIAGNPARILERDLAAFALPGCVL
jgi:sugar O-acyltransferase (sialic acid O-acetyltransferase NeuD family)